MHVGGHFVANSVQLRVVLIDGPLLAQLMIKHGVGIQVKRTITLVEIDEDFFEYNRHNPSCALWTERCLLGETAVIINETPSSQSLTHKIPGTISQLDSV